jgi:mono/diheme cytochrome c family protein
MRLAHVPHGHKAWFMAAGAVALVLLGAAAGAVVLLSGAFSTEATKQHFRITYRILEWGLRFSVRGNADKIQVPDLTRVASIEVGQACYRTYCEQCHGAPGIARDPLGRGQLPSPSNLSQSAREWPAAHLFYVTQKGVRMSGMPAWEFRIAEEGIWSIVAFLQQMPSMTRAEYEAMSVTGAAIACPRPARNLPYSAERAQTMLRQYACDNCHRIGGMVGPKTSIGPTLEDWARRKYIAGVLPNTRENLVRWIVDPQGVSPDSIMPNMEVLPMHAQDMARYLFERR